MVSSFAWRGVSVVWREIKIALFYQTSPSQNSKSFCGDTLKARRTTLERLSLRWYFYTHPHFQLSRRVAALLWSSYLLENTMVIMKRGWIFLRQYMQVLMSHMMCTRPIVVAYNLLTPSPTLFGTHFSGYCCHWFCALYTSILLTICNSNLVYWKAAKIYLLF